MEDNLATVLMRLFYCVDDLLAVLLQQYLLYMQLLSTLALSFSRFAILLDLATTLTRLPTSAAIMSLSSSKMQFAILFSLVSPVFMTPPSPRQKTHHSNLESNSRMIIPSYEATLR